MSLQATGRVYRGSKEAIGSRVGLIYRLSES